MPYLGGGNKHSWSKMLSAVNGHIREMNTGYEYQLRSKKVKYYNALGSFVDPHTIQATYADGKTETVTADKVSPIPPATNT